MTAAVDVNAQRDALIGRLTEASAGMFRIYTTYLGDQLGLYAALAICGACTCSQLARETGTVERYVREWLEQQTVIGILTVDDPNAPSTERRYQLPPGHAEVLAERDNINYLALLAQLMVGTVQPISRVLDAFRTGAGVPFGDFGSDMLHGQSGLNRNAFLQLLGQEWLPKVPDVHDRLGSDPPARLAEIGCGAGWASIGLARAYPRVSIDGFDMDESSIALAQANANATGLRDRVQFTMQDASQVQSDGDYDLVLAFECIHDMADPVGALRMMRRLAAPGGAVIVMDVRRSQRGHRVVHVRLQRAALLTRAYGGATIRGNRNRHTTGHVSGVRATSRVPRDRGAPD